MVTLPDTNIATKNGGSNRKFLSRGLFSGAMLVSGGVYGPFSNNSFYFGISQGPRSSFENFHVKIWNSGP